MKRLTLLSALLLCAYTYVYAQADIVDGEYYWNSDPGVGMATPLSNFPASTSIDETFNISTPTTIDDGIQFLFFRFRDDNGSWSMAQAKAYLFKPDLVALEYFWNTDPGIGNGTQIATTPAISINQSFNITVPSLSTGINFLYVRVKDEFGRYSLLRSQFFTMRAEVVSAEYFWNNDPGVGLATPIALTSPGTTISQAINVLVPADLPLGIQNLYVRVKDNQGHYSMQKNQFFINKGNIVAAEYYWDTDPGLGNGSPLSISNPMAMIDETFNINHDNLPSGNHTLHVRVKESGGRWSHVQSQDILKECLIPTSLTVQTTHPDEAILSWTDQASATEWQVEYGIKGYSPGQGTKNLVTTEQETLTGLASNTSYDWYVRTVCIPGDTSEWTMGPTFTLLDCVDDNYSVYFDGIDDGFALGSVPSGTNYSFSFYLYIDAIDDGDRLLTSGVTGDTDAYDFYLNADGSLSANTGGGNYTTVSTPLTTGTWHHIAFSRESATSAMLYINGVSDLGGFSVSSNLGIQPETTFGLPYLGTTGGYIHGMLDELALWNGPLTQATILDLLDDQLTGIESNIIAYYAMNEGNGDTVADDSANSYTASMSGDLNDRWRCGADYITNLCVDDQSHNYALPETCETCTDGIQNGDETDVDCGGSLCASCCGDITYSSSIDFIDKWVTPPTGNPLDIYRWEITYTNVDGTLPDPTFPKILLDYEGDGAFTSSDDKIYSMTELDAGDTDVTDGKIYYVEATGLIAGSDYETTIQVVNSCATLMEGPFDNLDILDPVDINVFASDISFSNNNPNPGDPLDVMVTIHNVSSYSADNFSVRLSNQFDGSTYTDMTGITIPAGSQTTLTWNIITPSTVAFVPIQVDIDIDNVLPEPNEDDNTAVRPFINGAYSGNTSIMVDATVMQISPTQARITGFAWYDDLPLPLPDTSVAGGEVVVTIDGVDYSGLTDENGLFSFTISPTVGNYNIDGSVTDFTLTGNFNISGFQSCKPDLVVTGLNHPSTVMVFTDFTLSYSVKNVGCLDALSSSILSLTLPDGIPSFIQVTVPPLDSGEVHTGQVVLQYGSTGLKSMTAETDINDQIDEYSENNNLFVKNSAIQVIEQPCPGIDLRIPAIAVGNPINQCGRPITITLYNNGTDDAGPFSVINETLYNGIVETSDTIVVAGLNSLTAGNLSFFPTFNNTESYTIRSIIDQGQVINECDENNNEKSIMKNITACAADLTVQCLLQGATPVDAESGDVIDLHVVISNIGNDNITSDIENKVSYDGQDYFFTITGGLTPGSVHNETISLTYNGSTISEAVIEVDQNNLIAELNESNNILSEHLGYDFIPSELCHPAQMFWERNYLVDQPINFNTGINNLGLLSASTLTASFTLVSGPGVSSPVLLTTGSIASVDYNCGCPTEITGDLPASFNMTGTYTIEIEVDPSDDYSEEVENNNTLLATIDVVVSPDYLAKAEYISPSVLNPAIDEIINIDLTIENIDETLLDSLNVEVRVDEIFLDKFRIKGLVSGDQFTASVPMSWSSNIPGAHVIRYIIDSDEEHLESDENNNEATRTVIVGDAPNLLITQLTLDNLTPIQGITDTIMGTIQNSGAVASMSEILLSYETPSGETISLGTIMLNVASGQSIDFSYPFPNSHDGNNLIIAEITSSSPPEINELDNTTTYNFSVLSACSLEVIHTGDSGYGSLREAIACANVQPGPDTITFNIPGSGPHVINPSTKLPTISGDSTVIDGTSQPGNFPSNGKIVLSINDLIESNKICLEVNSKFSEIYGLTFHSDNLGPTTGVFYFLKSDSLIFGGPEKGNNYIGTQWVSCVFIKENINSGIIQGNNFYNSAGTIKRGINITPGTNNILIGGQLPGEENIFKENTQYGIRFENSSNNNQVINNRFEECTIAIANDGNRNNGANLGNQFIGNAFICNDENIANSIDANNNITPPTISISKVNFISGTADPGSMVEIYASQDTCVSLTCPGGTSLGTTITDNNGDFYFALPADQALNTDMKTSAIQTDLIVSGSSEFSVCNAVDSLCLDIVYTCDDNIIGSLRSAIECATEGDVIFFLTLVKGDTLLLDDSLTIDKDLIIEGFSDIPIHVLSSSDEYTLRLDGKELTIKNLIIDVQDNGANRIIDNLGNLTLENFKIIDRRMGAALPTIVNHPMATMDVKGLVEVLKE